ncbi:hypothetical protein M758_6G047100 [Ceratodon purpureus]|nr:hypothetical protein M758_6G047100 [Ceratodon purpureus]
MGVRLWCLVLKVLFCERFCVWRGLVECQLDLELVCGLVYVGVASEGCTFRRSVVVEGWRGGEVG